MTTKRHVALGTAVLAAAVLTLSLFGAAPRPAQPGPAALPAAAASPGGMVAERPAADDGGKDGLNDGPSATGIERIPVFR